MTCEIRYMYTYMIYAIFKYRVNILLHIYIYVTLSEVAQTNLVDVLMTCTLIHGDSRSDSIILDCTSSFGKTDSINKSHWNTDDIKTQNIHVH